MSEIRDIKPIYPTVPVQRREQDSSSQRRPPPPPKPRPPVDEQDNADRPSVDEYV